MAQRTEFTYQNIELYKSESLGSGSYGGVCKAKCDGLLCAAKIMHPTLFDLRDPGTASYLHKFQEECRLLSFARHPNVVQYLATYYDPNTRLPVLLMELCDQSLTTFLERSPGPLSYHIQINICHDIALALVYLHSNGLIHRDLTGNNVLMIAGTRAKITDFGMSKLATVNPRMTALTLCPGNLLYMSPEALDEAKSYTAKLDIFSFGVIAIQILTREFPNPTDRFRTIQVPDIEEEVRVVVPETERRQSQLKLIPDTHSLKPVVLQCLKKEGQRPSAVELRERLSALKQSSQYTESQRQTQSSSDIQQLQQQLRVLTEAKTRELRERETRITELESIVEEKSDIQQLQQQLQGQRILTEAKTRELRERETRITELESIVEEKSDIQQLQQQLQGQRILTEAKTRELRERETRITELESIVEEKQHLIETKDRQLQENQRTIVTSDRMVEMKERELQRTQQQLQASEQIVSEFQESLQQNEKAIRDLGRRIPESTEITMAVVGLAGQGKSALVNSLLLIDPDSKEAAETGDTLQMVTRDVICYTNCRDNVTVKIWDTPGLCADATIGTETVIKLLRERAGDDVDLFLYCVAYYPGIRIGYHIMSTFKFFDKEFWRKTIFVMTIVNKVTIESRKKIPQLAEHIENGLKVALRRAGVPEYIIQSKRLLLAGRGEEPLAINENEEIDWNKNLFIQCLRAIEEEKRVTLTQARSGWSSWKFFGKFFSSGD